LWKNIRLPVNEKIKSPFPHHPDELLECQGGLDILFILCYLNNDQNNEAA
jgi:hypothetical protein